MATEVTRVTIGDYEYTLYDDQTARAMVTNTSKSSYGALQASVTHQGVTYALTSLYRCFEDCTSLTTTPSIPNGVQNTTGCFRRCTSLTTAPAIPSGVTNMDGCFSNCTSLTTAPAIPSGVVHMTMCFSNCTSLTTAPAIPSGVVNMRECFSNCTSLTTAPSIPSSVGNIMQCFSNCLALTGTIAVHGTPAYYYNCFYNTTFPIVLVVTDSSETPTWQAVARTGNNGNVTVRDVSANPVPTATITAVRVLSSGSTTPDETGQYAYVTVRTTASTEQAPDNVAQAPTITLDGATYTPTDPSGTATFTCHVSLGDDLGHVIGATPRDTYKTGTEVTVTLASTYSPMEFHQGGDGASFGKHAGRAGVLDVAWDIESDGDVSAAGDVSGTNVTATGDVSAAGDISGASVDATGEVKGSDCKSANYSLEDVGDSISQPARNVTPSAASGVSMGSTMKCRVLFGCLVIVNINLNAGSVSAAGSTLFSGFPAPTSDEVATVSAQDNTSRRVRVRTDGKLYWEGAGIGNSWVNGQIVYYTNPS